MMSLTDNRTRNIHATVFPPQPPEQLRSVSTRHLTSRARPTRLSSIIVHDVPEETTRQRYNIAHTTRPNTDASVDLPSVRPTRTKKAKESQTRLGVGRPVAMGGTGPRAVTRSATVSRERLKSSRSTQQIETTIQEGEPSYAPDISTCRCLKLVL